MKEYNLPTKKWAEWASSVTGNPTSQYWNQGMLYLVEVEGFSGEEALRMMNENWNE